MKTIEMLCRFVDQRPGFDWHNYGDAKSYRAEMREVTNDRRDFYDLLQLALRRMPDLEDRLTAELTRTGDRLSLVNGQLQYITGQYFPTEYRPAACRTLVRLIWDDYRRECREDGTRLYEDGHALRRAIRRNFSRRVNRNYFH